MSLHVFPPLSSVITKSTNNHRFLQKNTKKPLFLFVRVFADTYRSWIMSYHIQILLDRVLWSFSGYCCFDCAIVVSITRYPPTSCKAFNWGHSLLLRLFIVELSPPHTSVMDKCRPTYRLSNFINKSSPLCLARSRALYPHNLHP